jgi:putative DNA-invertase from lambdoid prophage Rac
MARDKLATPGRCYGYCRASTEEQETTLEAQQAQIAAMYHAKYKPKGYSWGGVYTDSGISGSVPLASRPAGRKLLLSVEPGDAILMQKIDRGWRSVADWASSGELFRRSQIGLAFVEHDIDTSTTAGEAFAGIAAIFAQMERRMIGDRMRAFQAQRKRQGRPYTHSAPYGYRIVGDKGNRQYAPWPEQRAIGARILEWHEQGWKLRDILAHVTNLGWVHPEKGEPLTLTTIWRWAKEEKKLRDRERSGGN